MTQPDRFGLRPSSADASRPRYSGVGHPIHVRAASTPRVRRVPCLLPNVLDAFDNRSFATDNVPLFPPTTTPRGGDWGVASSLIPWVIVPGGSSWFTVTGGVGRITYDPNRYFPGFGVIASASAFQNLFTYLFTSPVNDEPVLSFRFRTSLVPDGAVSPAFPVTDARRPTTIHWQWESAGHPRVSGTPGHILAGDIVLTSTGSGSISVSFYNGFGVTVAATLTKTDWVANAWYTVSEQHLHDGTVRLKVVRDGEVDPGWQVTYASDYDYVGWDGGGSFFVSYVTNDTYSVAGGGHFTGDVIHTDFDQITMGYALDTCP